MEVNSRVNFPIKRALKRALTLKEQNNFIDMDCPTTKFCVSLMSGKLCQVGIQRHVSDHRIPGIYTLQEIQIVIIIIMQGLHVVRLP